MTEKNTLNILVEPDPIYIEVEITPEKAILNFEKFFESGQSGKFKIKLEKIDEL